jgi:metal-dependent amidase/aminoacylase/carboxypeptidase family protein
VGYPSLYNNEGLTDKFRHKSIEYLGKENVITLPLRMTAEDFAYYGHEVKGCFYRLGTGNKEKGITSAVHTPTFDVDEDSLEIGMGVMAWVVV